MLFCKLGVQGVLLFFGKTTYILRLIDSPYAFAALILKNIVVKLQSISAKVLNLVALFFYTNL